MIPSPKGISPSAEIELPGVNAALTVYTSGYSSIFPADIPLGTAGDATIVNGATYEIKIRLFEDFGALRHVTIVENLGSEEMKALEAQK